LSPLQRKFCSWTLFFDQPPKLKLLVLRIGLLRWWDFLQHLHRQALPLPHFLLSLNLPLAFLNKFQHAVTANPVVYVFLDTQTLPVFNLVVEWKDVGRNI
jgi:hypothetical protein